MFNHEVIRFVKRDGLFADVDINRIYCGRNDQVIAESLIDGEQIKAIDIAYDGHYAIFVVYKKMSVFLVKLMKTGDVLYLSKENEVVYHKDSHAGPKCTKKGVFFVKSSSKIHHEFFMFENEEVNQVSNFNTSIVSNIQVDIKADEFESGGSIIETPSLLPKNYNKKGKYPLLIYIHGVN